MAGDIATESKQEKAAVSVKLSGDKLAAFVVVASDPPPGGPLDPQVIHATLRQAGVVHGIDEEAVREAARCEKLDQDIQVADGTPAQPGEDARIEFKVKLESDGAPKVGKDGRIDYKNIDFLQNASESTVLAVKHPRTEGTPGRDVLGKEVSALRGKDKSLPMGSNTYVSRDKLQLLAKTDGSIVYAGKRINIQPISTISGSISVKTGNINAIGSLQVRCDIEAGYTVQVGGDLEVNGNVLDSTVECGGNMMIKGGFIGRGNGQITAQGNVTVRYVENQSINAQGDITIGGEVLNSHLFSGNAIYFKGGKGRVVGGEINARNQISAKEMGNEAGTTTIARVGYDAKLMGEYLHTKKEIERLQDDLQRVKEGLYVLVRLQMDGKLPAAKRPVLEKLKQFRASAPDQLSELQAKMKELEKKIAENAKAKIAVEGRIYPGVMLYFGLVYYQLDRMEQNRIYDIEYGKVTSSPYDKSKVKVA